MKLKTIDLGWLGALALLFLFFKAIDIANGKRQNSQRTPSRTLARGAGKPDSREPVGG